MNNTNNSYDTNNIDNINKYYNNNINNTMILIMLIILVIRRPGSAWYGNILCRIQTMSGNPNPNPKSKIQNPNDAVWGRRKKNED